MVTITRKQEGNSWLMEDKGAREALNRLQQGCIPMEEVIHDDKASMDSIIEETGIRNQKDLWHRAKNLVKKFVEKMVSATFTISVNIDDATSRSDLQAATKKRLQEWLKARGVRRISTLRKEALVHKVANLRGLPQETLVQIKVHGLKYPELSDNEMATKLKTWFYIIGLEITLNV
ncbi:unnamed protein product [Calypogeia fissa]